MRPIHRFLALTSLLGFVFCFGACEKHSPYETVPGYAEKMAAKKEAAQEDGTRAP